MRCNNCNKFVSFDTDTEPEVDNLEVDESGNVTGTVRIVNACAECGDELSEGSFDLEVDFSQEYEEHVAQDENPTSDAHSLSVESDSADRTDRRQTTDRRGKVIKPRYQKQFYGASVQVTITCDCLDDKTPETKKWACTKEWSDEIQASGMDSLQ